MEGHCQSKRRTFTGRAGYLGWWGRVAVAGNPLGQSLLSLVRAADVVLVVVLLLLSLLLLLLQTTTTTRPLQSLESVVVVGVVVVVRGVELEGVREKPVKQPTQI